MTSQLKVQSKKDGAKLCLRFSGSIDEDSEFPEFQFKDTKELRIDFESLEYINSTGIKKWVEFLKLVPQEVQIFFEKCPSRIIEQMNMVRSFTGGHTVEVTSFFAPYYCNKCDETKSKLLMKSKHYPWNILDFAPEFQCEACNQLLEFDGIERKYFAIFKRNKAS